MASLKLRKREDPSLWKAESSGVGWMVVNEHGSTSRSKKPEEGEGLKRDRRFGR